MSNLNWLNYYFPYFGSKEDQTLYVMIPVANPMVFKHSQGNTGKIENFSIEEEIVPDFKCEKCSVRVLTYSELNAHQKDHEKSELNKSYFLGIDQVEGLRNTNYYQVFQKSTNSSMFHHLKYGSHLGTTAKIINSVSNKVLPSQTVSDLSHERDKRHLSSNILDASFENSDSILHNLKVPDCSKSEQTLQIQDTMLGTEIKNPNLLKLPLMQKLNKCSIYVQTFNRSNSKVSNLSPIKDNFEVNLKLPENLSVTRNLHLPEISREGNLKRKNISTAESSTTKSAPTFTYADSKGLLTSIKRKKNIPVVKHYSNFSRRHKFSMMNVEANTDLRCSNFSVNVRENSCKVNQSVVKLNSFFPTFQTLFGKSKSTDSIYSEKEISIEDITENKTTGYYENISSDINPLQSMDVYDHCVPIGQQLTEAKDKDELNSKESVVFKRSFVAGSFPETLSGKGICETMDNFNDFFSKNQPVANMKVSGVSPYSKCEVYTEKNDRYKAIKYDDRSPLKMSSSQTVGVNENDVYVLEPLTNAKEKPYRCFYCRKTFESRFHMKKHLLEHKETKTDFCALCCSFFTRIESFREHVLIFHCQAKDEKQCPYCDYRYFRKTNFENHIASRHATRGFKNKCKNCMQEFETVKDLNNHIAREHFNRNFDV